MKIKCMEQVLAQVRANYQVFNEPPEGFDLSFQAAGCYCRYEDKILLLRRHPTRYDGNTWGVPGGKFEKGETARQAVVREVLEEVGIDIDNSALLHVGTFYMRHPGVEYVFHTFYLQLDKQPCVVLNLEEHVEARWVTLEEAWQLPLVRGGEECLMHCHQRIDLSAVKQNVPEI